jgi:hypothetical protein
VMLRHHLRALLLQECCEYVSNRLKVAGGDRSIFTSDALESIYFYSSGIPRIVNVLCDNALLTGYALGRKELDNGIIREVAEDFSLTTNQETHIKPIRQVVNNTNGTGSARASNAGSIEIRSGIESWEPKPTAVKPISKSTSSTAIVPANFLNTLATALTDAMGPMSKIVLRDQIKGLGESSEMFPHAKVEMLLESVSREILDDGMRAQFRQRILEQIRTLQTS